MSIELIPLTTAELVVNVPPIVVGDVGSGTRLIVEIASSQWTGERLTAKQIGSAAADWPLVTAEGIGRLDVRSTLQTHDGAVIYVHYQGRSTTDANGTTLYAAPLFETADPRYTWLNKIQAVAKGRVLEDQRLVYEIYELR